MRVVGVICVRNQMGSFVRVCVCVCGGNKEREREKREEIKRVSRQINAATLQRLNVVGSPCVQLCICI